MSIRDGAEPVFPEVSDYIRDGETPTADQLVELICKFGAYSRWAKDKVSDLLSRLVEAKENNRVLLRDLDTSEEALKGLQAYVDSRKKAIETYEIGTRVLVNPTLGDSTESRCFAESGFDGKIEGIVLSAGGRVEYNVSWWVAGIRYRDLLTADEFLVPSERPIPPPRTTVETSR